MKLGLCTGPENIALAAELGFDYVEIGLSALAAMEEADYQALVKKKDSFAIPVLCCNGAIPGDVKTTGPDACEEKQRAYLEKAFSRASSLGVKTVVYGSGASRGVPEGWKFFDAWQQIIAFLKLAAEYCEKYDIRIAIEPLRRKECNIVNLVSEGLLLSAAVDHPRIGVLGDTFHMLSSAEPYQALANAGDRLYHVHISHSLPDLSGRIYPAEGDGEDYAGIFDTLRAMGYEGGVSVEAGCKDVRADGENAIRCLKKYV